MNGLTKEQKDLLHKAIDLAKGPGACKYTQLNSHTETIKGDDGQVWQRAYSGRGNYEAVNTEGLEPMCVAAQVAVLAGVPVVDLLMWKNTRIDTVCWENAPGASAIAPFMDVTVKGMLYGRRLPLLRALQEVWDIVSTKNFATTEARRIAMHNLVDCVPTLEG